MENKPLCNAFKEILRQARWGKCVILSTVREHGSAITDNRKKEKRLCKELNKIFYFGVGDHKRSAFVPHISYVHFSTVLFFFIDFLLFRLYIARTVIIVLIYHVSAR